MAESTLKEAMLEYAPGLARNYEEFVRSVFYRMQDDLGPTLKGVYSNPRWAHHLPLLRNSLDQVRPSGSSVFSDIPYTLNESRLRKEAKDYGDRTALEWYYKMQEKLGDLDDITVSPPSSGSVQIEGHHGADVVTVDQHPIINVSSRGLLFHQFPAHIYVNHKFQSEVQYKKTIQGWGVAEVKREKKPKKPAIDPNSRPREFKFSFKVEYIGTPELPHNYGRVDAREEQAKGVTEAEAWNKIYRQETRESYYKRVFDQRVVSIRAWNGELIWKESSGDPKPENGVILDVDQWVEQTKTTRMKRSAARMGYRDLRSSGASPGVRSMR